MLGNIAIIRCSRACELHCVCRSHASALPHVAELRKYCRETRWLVLVIAGVPAAALAVWLLRQFA